ncbi:hypothetical protein ASG59_18625 [Methylobacterium sp. Leaf466]|nr:hypothetical protein ASG59_18625 [Methylobacterium sp. Leaf466]
MTLNGEERCLTAWALIFGVRQQTVEKRMREQGMGALGALYLPVGRCGARKRKLDPIVAEIAAFYAA